MKQIPTDRTENINAASEYCIRARALLNQLQDMLGADIPTTIPEGFAQNALAFCGVRNALENINYAIDELGHGQEGGVQ
jgi:hypothetical protein